MTRPQEVQILQSDELLSAAAACERLGIDRSTLSRWVSSGRIPTVHRTPDMFSRDVVEQAATSLERKRAAAAIRAGARRVYP